MSNCACSWVNGQVTGCCGAHFEWHRQLSMREIAAKDAEIEKLNKTVEWQATEAGLTERLLNQRKEEIERLKAGDEIRVRDISRLTMERDQAREENAAPKKQIEDRWNYNGIKDFI